jgi:hypothetical protein
MCLQVLKLDRRYSDVQPRRPNGGPDGGRDIQAIFRGEIVFGAVGFLNSVSDDAKDKRKIKKKFKDGLDAALEAKSDLAGFVFFTNADLTPGERDKLIEHARGKGVAHVEIYWRDLIRTCLDGPEGFAIRAQYLQIMMNDAEQAAFFSRFGNELQDLITDRFSLLDRKIARLEFLLECQSPLTRLRIDLGLKRSVRSVDLAPYRLLLVVQDQRSAGQPALCLVVRGDRSSDTTVGQEIEVSLVCGGSASRFGSGRLISISTNNIDVDADLRAGVEFLPMLGSLNHKRVLMYCTKSLIKHISSVSLTANDYLLSSHPVSEIMQDDVEATADIPMMMTLDLPEGETWIELAPHGRGPLGRAHLQRLHVYGDWIPDFRSYVPGRSRIGDQWHIFTRSPRIRIEEDEEDHVI